MVTLKSFTKGLCTVCKGVWDVNGTARRNSNKIDEITGPYSSPPIFSFEVMYITPQIPF